MLVLLKVVVEVTVVRIDEVTVVLSVPEDVVEKMTSVVLNVDVVVELVSTNSVG